MKKLLHEAVGAKAFLPLLLLVCFLGGCSGAGRVLPVDQRISFGQQDNGNGIFSYGSLTVGYSYQMTDENMIIDGDVNYRGGADSLDVRVLFLDTAGSVLEKKKVYSSGYRVTGSRMVDRRFKESLTVPPGSAGLSFSCFARPPRTRK